MPSEADGPGLVVERDEPWTQGPALPVLLHPKLVEQQTPLGMKLVVADAL
jgi:hypothetical protein